MQTNFKGIILITLSALCFGSYGIWSKLMGDMFGDFDQAYLRSFLLLIILVPIAIITKQLKYIKKADLKWFIVVGISGGFNQAPYYLAFQKLSVGTATLLFYAALVVGGYLMGKIFFGEKIGFFKLISLSLALLGLFCIFQFNLATGQIWAALMAIVAGLMGGTEVALTKKISLKYSNIQILIFLFSIMFIGNGLISLLIGSTLPFFSFNTSWIALLAYALMMLLAMFFVIQGFKYTSASLGSLLGLTEIIFAAALGIIIFKETVGWSTILGGSLIIASAALPYIVKDK